MAGNPLIGTPEPTPKAPAKRPDQLVTLVSNVPPNQVTGIEEFLSVFNTDDVGAQIQPFRYVVSRKARRSIGGKFGAGLSSEVVESVKINLNEDLGGLRRWLGAVRADPASVLLLNISKVKDEALAAPLIFSMVLKTGRPVLVSGADQNATDQLFTEIDLTCKSIPGEIRRNSDLANSLRARVQRKKGFMATVRNLLDFDFLDPEIREKINKINSGGDPTILKDEELINLTLLADLASRYQYVISNFKSAYTDGTAAMNQMVSMFELLLSDLPMNQTIAAFKDFLGEEGHDALKAGKIVSKQVLFGYLHQNLNQRDGSSRAAKEDPKGDFLKVLANVVIRHRARVDPFLWKRCSFLGNQDETEKSLFRGLEPLHLALKKVIQENPDEPPPQVSIMIGKEIFELLKIAGMPPEKMNSGGDAARSAAAARALALLEVPYFNPMQALESPDKFKDQLASVEAFAKFFQMQPIKTSDLKKVSERLQGAMFRMETIAEQVRKGTLDVLAAHAKDRERLLRKIYIIKALPELTKFSFHLADAGLSNVERICGLSILRSRFGLEIQAKPTYPDSIGLFERESEKPLGSLENDPELLSHAYTELMSLQVETNVRRAVDHKINYLQSTYGDNFFEVIFESVVSRFDLPLSSNQFATIVRQRGILSSLDSRGWNKEEESEVVDPFLKFESLESRHKEDKEENKTLKNFEQDFKSISATFSKMLNELKASAESDPREDNPRKVIWSLFKRGIYNLSSDEAKAEFKKTPFYEQLKQLIVKISSENYSIFANDTQQGVKIFIPRKYDALAVIGNRFSFLVENKVVRYQLLITPVVNPEDLDPISRAFYDGLEKIFDPAEATPEFNDLVQVSEDIHRSIGQWQTYSQYLAFAILDRVLGETVIKQLIPGKIGSENLFFLGDHTKLCLGPALTAGATLPFSKILQNPENMGNIQKNPRSSSTTIDDFAIEVHKISRLFDELSTMRGICEDLLDILQNLSHDRSESAHVQKYEQNLQRLIVLLSKPVRHVQEEDIQALHEAASGIKQVLGALFHGQSTSKSSVVNLLQSQLQSRRSDGHSMKLNFTDAFIIEKTEIRVMHKVKKSDGEITRRQRKVEVEVEAAYQTLISRIRTVINTQKIMGSKYHVIFSPEGQKQKQTDYVLDIIDVVQDLRGSAVTFYVDRATLSDSQEQRLATRVKPHNFFNMNLLKTEPPEGMNVKELRDPLSGKTRVVVTGNGQGSGAVAAAPTESFFRCSKAEGIEYRLDHAAKKYTFNDGGKWVPARALPFDLGDAGSSVILMTRLESGKIQFHGILGSEVLLPDAELRDDKTICGFQFLDRTVRVIKEDGKPVVQVEQQKDGFLSELRSL